MIRSTSPLTVLAVAALLVSPASASDAVFSTFNGNWSGMGQIKLDSGASERIKCNAYYTPKDAGAALGLAIRCASPSYKIELRSQLKSQGGKISGSWEERNFNAAGDVTGQASGSKISLSVAGGGMTGTMSVSASGETQSVTITTQGTGLRSVNISLSRG